MSSIKKVLCAKAKNEHDRKFTTGKVYDVEIDGGCGWVKDENGYSTCILFVTPCIYGEWQPLEEYICLTGIYPGLKIGDFFFGYKSDGSIIYPQGDGGYRQFRNLSNFKKVSEMTVGSDPKNRFEVRHVVFDTKDSKIVNDAMGECYITLAEAQEVCDEMNAPKVMKPKYTKEVEYFGMKVMVPDDTKWLSTSKRGSVFSHESKPIKHHGYYSGGDDHVVIGGVDLNGIDWKDTLMEIK